MKVTQLKEQIAKLEKLTNKDIELLNSNLMTLPNSPHEDVPVGKDETFNVEVKKHGDCSLNNNILSHDDIGERIGQLDFQTAIKISGSRIVILKKNIAKF